MQRLTTIFLLFVSGLAMTQVRAAEYPQSTAGTIHTIKVVRGWCGNLAISTKVGYLKNEHCDYVKETVAYGYDGCTQYLNGGLLEDKVGKGYTCGATHVKSRVDGKQAVDEFVFVLDDSGRYVGTLPSYREIELH